MKKIDFHIHTVSSIKDSNFEFSMDWLKEYVEQAELDAIAITNHDLFDIDNFNDITRALSPVVVYPGIELALDIGHVNIVLPTKCTDNLVDFSNWLRKIHTDKNQNITCSQLFEKLTCWKEGIYIFELGKSNGVLEIPSEFDGVTCVGGVSNSLRFNAVFKGEEAIVPVLFSDAHATENDCDLDRFNIDKLKEKTTYIQSDTCDFNDIRACFSDKTKVNINKENLRDVIDIGGNYISTGLNLVVGKRGTGKTHFLENIKDRYAEEDIYYISQFETAKPDEFIERNRREHGQKAIKNWKDTYRTQLNSILKYLDTETNENLEGFLDSVKTFANESERSNSKNKFTLFKETKFDAQEYEFIEKSLENIKSVIDREKLWDIIDKGQYRKRYFIDTYTEIRKAYIERREKVELSKEVNAIVSDVKAIITSRTGISSVIDCDLSSIIKMKQTERKICDFLDKVITPTQLHERTIHGYRVVVNAKPFERAESFRKSIRTNESVNDDLIKPYLKKDYITFLRNLKSKQFFNEANIAEYFMEQQVQLLDSDGVEASGGQAVGFALAMRLDEAKNKPIILIDEPESSLDNAYIREELNSALKRLAQNSMVIVITHNSTLGALLDPDYLIVTSKNGHGEYFVQSGAFNSGKISSLSSAPESSFQKFVEAMESGIESYNEKGKVYGNLSSK
ncbi:hypothetical protein NHG25_05005 [Aerococcaceae bacterium NML191292]|nr:hypothetical protein [Aerococcaceae bacterium NML191292]